MNYPLIRTNQYVYDFLKEESGKLGISMVEFLEIVMRTYRENPDLFSLATGGVIGKQPSWFQAVKEYNPRQKSLL